MRRPLLFTFLVLVAAFAAYAGRGRLREYAKAGLAPVLPRSQANPTGSVVLVNETDSKVYDRALRLSIRGAQKGSGIQNAVILLPRRPPNVSLEDLASKLFQEYRIGRDFGGKGVLLLYVEEDRRLKIEVSYPLESVFTDAICSRLEQGARTFMLTGQRRDFLTELLVTMNLQYSRYREGGAAGEVEFPYPEDAFALSRYLSGGAGVVGSGYSQAIEARLREVRSLSPAEGQRYQPDKSPLVVVERYLASLENGVGDPLLPLLTEGSQIYRLESPKTPGYQRRTFHYYSAAKPFQVHTKDGLAAAMFQPGHPVLQIFLRRTNRDVWLVDEAQMWAHQHLFEDGSRPRQKYPGNPFHFAWLGSRPPEDQILYAHAAAPAPLAYPHRLHDEIAAHENSLAADPDDAENYFRLADLLYFETYWLAAAIPLYEAGLGLAPARYDVRWRLVDLYLNNTDYDQVLYQYRLLRSIHADDAYVGQVYEFYRTMLEVTDAEVAQFSPVSLTVPKSVLLERIAAQRAKRGAADAVPTTGAPANLPRHGQ